MACKRSLNFIVNQPKHPSKRKLLINLVNYTMEHHTAIKKNKVHLQILTQEDVLDILFCMILPLLKNKMKKIM